MYRPGHHGAAMLVYAPIAGVVSAFGFELLALAGAVVVVGGTMVPDYDRATARIPRRGPTHTVWFAGLFGGLVGVAGALFGFWLRGSATAVWLFGFGLLTGALAVSIHVVADALTVEGVQPFAPVSETRYAVGIEWASSVPANYVLLGVGAVVLAVAFLAGGTIAG